MTSLLNFKDTIRLPVYYQGPAGECTDWHVLELESVVERLAWPRGLLHKTQSAPYTLRKECNDQALAPIAVVTAMALPEPGTTRTSLNQLAMT